MPPPPARSRVAAAHRGVAAAPAGPEDEEQPLAFGGGHVLEFFDLTPAVKTQHLEECLERLCRGHAAPPVVK